MIEYLIRLLQPQYRLATLSRGYGRKSRGFRIADSHDSAATLGDEPFQLYKKYGQKITVSVGEERAVAIPLILQEHEDTNVILLDDAESLIDAIVANKLPMDTFVYLQSLLEKHPQLGIALTLDTGREAHLEALSPLVSPASVFRLDNLTLAETTQLLREPVTGLYAVSDEAVNAVQTATGGAPLLLQRYGF